ncbi:MAG: ATP-binding protein [Eubacteriales bacterium]|nr:ATP-binding protein [Eubacteriales bacterium]
MLVNFRFRNCRSFYDEANLSMQATSDNSYKELNTFEVPGTCMLANERELLKSAIIFGGNASGKTNVIKAFYYMVAVIRLSSAQTQVPVVAENETFALKVGANYEPSLYEAEFIQNGKYYKYGFELCNNTVIHEWLYRREERLTKVFERIGQQIEIKRVPQEIKKVINVSGTSLFLSIANNFILPDVNEYINDVIEWFSRVIIVFKDINNSLDIYTIDNGKYKKSALDILKKADIGITEFEVVKDKIANKDELSDMEKLNNQIMTDPSLLRGQIKAEREGLYHIDLKTGFNVYDDNDNLAGEKEVMLFKEGNFNSDGTKRLLCYLGWVMAALDHGRVIIIDEIDSQLHFLVVDYIIKLFNSIKNNQNNAQLICTAHNVILMDDGLRRDQIYFTGKDRFGKSSLVSLADYAGVRKQDLFSKRYLAGFYSSLPKLEEE